jgi:hypothetical protein
MTLAGNETFEVERNGQRRKVPLAKLDALDVLGLANDALRANKPALAAALYAWQWRIQYGRCRPPPRAA